MLLAILEMECVYKNLFLIKIHNKLYTALHVTENAKTCKSNGFFD